MPDFKISNKFGGFVTPQKNVNVEILKKVFDDSPELADDFKKVLVKKGVAVDIFHGENIFEGPFKTLPGTLPTPPVPVPPVPTPTTPEQTQPSFEIDTRLQLLISSIPIANPGNIITSEYHNALRDAVRALASRIGLSVNPTAEFKILTFSPNLMPTKSTSPNVVNLNWDVTLNRAVNPAIGGDELNRPVSGGFVVQLPDNATIYQMIARGTRGAGAPNPNGFNIALKRQKFSKEKTQQTLISIDLKGIKDGAFEETERVELSDSDVAVFDANEGIAGATINERKTVNNEKWIYFVTADWIAGDNTEAEKFEINSIQIFCTV